MSDLAEVFNSAIEKSDKCRQCGTITARIGGDSQAHWCCNCGAKLRGNHPYTVEDIPPRAWDDEKKQWVYKKMPAPTEVPMPEPDASLHDDGHYLSRADLRTSDFYHQAGWRLDVISMAKACTYGAAREAAGYARGLADERERCASVAWAHYMDTCRRKGIGPDVLPDWCCAATLRGEVKP